MSNAGPIVNWRRRVDDAHRAMKRRFHQRAGRIASLRDQLALELRHRRVVVCFTHVGHHLYLGGIQLYMRMEERALDERGISYLSMWAADERRLGVSCDGAVLGNFDLDEVLAAFAALAPDGVQLVAVTIHHLKGWQLDRVEPLLDALAAPVTRFFIHDYHSICPNPNLTFGDVRYCGAPATDSQACTICHYGVPRRERLATMQALVAKLADRGTQFIAPSETAAAVWRANYPAYEARLRVQPHQELVANGTTPRARRRKPRVGFLGHGTVCKGSNQWTELLATPDLHEHFLLFHFGSCSVNCSAEHVDVSFVDDGPDAMRRALQSYGIDFAFLWSIWPETFAFTCYEAISAGTFVLTNGESGNTAAQVERTGRGRVFADVAELQRFLFDAEAVEAARASIAGRVAFRPIWSDTLASELA